MDGHARVAARPQHDRHGHSDLGGSTRRLLLVFTGLTLTATSLLFVLAPRTALLFSWTISPPLSAAFLGAGYGAGCVLSVLALRSRSWRDARAALLTVLVFTVLTLVATLAHLDRFHFGASGLIPRLAAWIWLVVYTTVPLALGVVVVRDTRRAGRTSAVPGRGAGRLPPWLAVALGLQGCVMLAAGLLLFFAPSTTVWWPWPLSPLTSRMTAAWLLALGVAVVLALREQDVARLRIPAVAYVVFGVLQVGALLRFGDAVRWGSTAAGVYVAALVAVLATSVAGVGVTLRDPGPDQQEEP